MYIARAGSCPRRARSAALAAKGVDAFTTPTARREDWLPWRAGSPAVKMSQVTVVVTLLPPTERDQGKIHLGYRVGGEAYFGVCG